MHPYEEHIHHLLLDNRFIDWVVNPQSPYAEYWLQWIAADNENAALAEEAKRFILEMRRAEQEGAEDVHEDKLDEMLANIKTGIAPGRRGGGHKKLLWLAAAIVTGAMAVSTLFFLPKTHPGQEGSASQVEAADVVRYNGNKEDELLFLPDGSKVILSKGARISYNLLMNGSKREITLSGDAFFDVAPNAQKPFYIYTQHVVVKVLGTSFKVNASGGKESVAVSTGKVSVYLKGQDLEQSAAQIVLPKQVVSLTEDRRALTTNEWSGKYPAAAALQKPVSYDFEEAPLSTVLTTLEKMYAIPVKYNEDSFNNCFITISLGDESLEEILKVITRTVDASYSMSSYGITIEGKGCR
ncbi:FecR family protein [Chitinophaga sp. GCM10012297]|uniref:FecR family protein n=1 Tax=Chitinophaga chungangae TaxID=2821488 RepID=A0ABS3YD57_9BACT|nr:FecR family protein [Chitinophaga chungangae]MBO9152243.1 FecR family protein [Chitinophaga chungangae]